MELETSWFMSGDTEKRGDYEHEVRSEILCLNSRTD